MKLPAPRVIAIDDVQDDLDELTKALNRHGAACLPIHFSGDDGVVPRCPAVRVIFADLHLVPGHTEDAKQQFSVIASLIEEKIKPSGAYLVILWTRYPEEASACREFLHERLEAVSKPFAVVPLDKSEYLDDKKDHPDVGQPNPGKSLEHDIERVVLGLPHVAALLNWEERALEASAATVGAIQSLAVHSAGADDPEKEFASLLGSLATAAAGEHVATDPFQAVNGALLPIVADRLAAIPSSRFDDALWRKALVLGGKNQQLDLETAARLNRLLHFAMPPESVRGDERGAVIALPEKYRGDAFKETFGLSASDAASGQFACSGIEDAANSDRWVLVQCQAACDYAQRQPGPVPFHLGLLVPNRKVPTPPQALWRSPCFDREGEVCCLHVNARFSLSLPRAQVEVSEAMFRLREQLVNQLIYNLHSYGARPGIVSFREQS